MADETPNVTRDARTESLPYLPRGEKDYALLARMIVCEGKTFKDSALAAGFSDAVARTSLRLLMSQSSLVSSAIRAEWDRVNASVEQLKPMAITRLYREIADPESSAGMKAIELAGRFKETDWFVRSSETNIGVFTAIIEQTISEPTKDYKE